jgi:lipoprotein Spr
MEYPGIKILTSQSMKQALLLLFITGFLFSSTFSQNNIPVGHGLVKKKGKSAKTASLPPPSKIDSLVTFAELFLGKPYRYASANPITGFDCSGFVSYVFAHSGISVPRSSRDYEKVGRLVSLDSCKKGDILVFTGTNAALRRAGHVGIVISGLGEPLTFIQSSSSIKQNGVIITVYADSPYYAKRFLKVVRVF